MCVRALVTSLRPYLGIYDLSCVVRPVVLSVFMSFVLYSFMYVGCSFSSYWFISLRGSFFIYFIISVFLQFALYLLRYFFRSSMCISLCI